jgi:hypothetical protein
MYRKNLEKNIAVVASLRSDPRRSNYAIAEQCSVAESVVRRQRIILEASGLLEHVDVRTGTDGVVRQASLA